MTKSELSLNSQAEDSSLPEIVKTPSGIVFNPNEDRWSFRDSVNNVSIDFTSLRCVPELVKSLKRALIWYAENRSSSHLENLFRNFENFLDSTNVKSGSPLTCITAADLLNYRASLVRKKREWHLSRASALFQKWHDLAIPGVTDDAIGLLKQLRIKGSAKGVAVLTMDPNHGPFTDIELQGLHTALKTAYQVGKETLEDCVLAYLFLVLGQRPAQIAALKVCDVQLDYAKDGTPIYVLRVPRAKQLNQLMRTEFKDRVLIPEIGKQLVMHASQVEEKYRLILDDPTQAPIFPSKQSQMKGLDGFKHHRTGDSLADTLVQVIRRLGINSERTGKPLNITATRFRRTVGTRAAIEGHGELVIAELLDHSNTQNVGVYIEAVPQIVERIDRAMAMHLAPLAQAFTGVVINDESEATRAGDPSSGIYDPRFGSSKKLVANCGKHGFCGLLAPIACYTCRSFEPWLDGPHEMILEHLLAERERLLAGNDVRIASINDRTILAVAEVVRRCQEMRKTDAGGA